jgi:chromate transporter
VKLWVLYLLLCKAMLSSFSGPTSLPVVQHDMVESAHVITNRQLDTAVAAGRVTPGPFGLYLVSVGYFIAGWPGAIIGFLALITPAFLILPMLQFLGKRIDRPVIRSSIRWVTLAAAGLLIGTIVPLAHDALDGTVPIVIAIASFLFLVVSKRSTLWVVVGSSLAGLLAAVFMSGFVH